MTSPLEVLMIVPTEVLTEYSCDCDVSGTEDTEDEVSRG